MNINECVGKTVLYECHVPSEEGDVQHGTVEELSRSSKYVRIDFRWYAVDRISVLEEMPNPNPGGDLATHQELIEKVEKLTATLGAAKEANKAPPALEIMPPAKTTTSSPASIVQTSEPAPPAPPVDNAHVESGTEPFAGAGTDSEAAPEASAAEPAPETT